MVADAKVSSQGSQGAAPPPTDGVASPQDPERARQVAEVLKIKQQLELDFKRQQEQVRFKVLAVVIIVPGLTLRPCC